MGTYWRKYGILKFKINFKWLYSFSLFLEKAPCSSNDKEQTQRKEVFTGTGKFCIMFVKSLNNKQYLLGRILAALKNSYYLQKLRFS